MNGNKYNESIEKYTPTSDICEHGIRLDWNESPFSPTPKIRQAFDSYIKYTHLNLYPPRQSQILRDAIARYTNTKVDNIEIFNGADGALKTIIDAFLDEDSYMLHIEPTYTQITPFLNNRGVGILTYRPRNIYSSGIGNLDAAIRMNNDILSCVYIANPNNPTGVLLDIQELKKIMNKYKNILFIIDESYYEFCGKTVLDDNLLPNCIIVRSFSKAFALAGVRLGYIITSPENIEVLSKIRNVKDINIFAHLCGTVVLNDIDYMKKCVNSIITMRDNFVKDLSDIGVNVRNTNANFVLVTLDNIKECIKYLEKNKIHVRDRSTMYGMKDTMRVSIGTDEQMNLVLAKIKEWVSE
jgi:histidinol-phosphate aminotransferase